MHHPLIIYSSRLKTQDIEIKNVEFQTDASGIGFDLCQKSLHIGRLKIAILGEYILADLLGAIQLVQMFDLTVTDITHAIEELKPVEHRLQPIYNRHTKIMVIDDSYNGNPQGVTEAIKVLAKFKQQRKVYLTPGLVEAGTKTEEIHYNIGKQLAKVAGMVILIKNSVTPFIAKGLQENGFEKENIIWFDSAKQAHDNLSKLLRPYDVILFQNDWPDNYL
jgi:UDP-N-acetylmuramoyl-tripeptide--D-alanyl-D-alanine ligase